MKLQIIHRGWFGKYPENTLEAMKEAFNHKFHGIETDLRLTKDNIWVLHHDETLEKLFNIKNDINQTNYKDIGNIYWNNKKTEIKLTKLIDLINLNQKYNKILNLELKVKLDKVPTKSIINLFNICEKQKENIIFSSFEWKWYNIIKNNDYRFAHLIEFENKLPEKGEYFFFNKNHKIPELTNIKIGIYTLKLQDQIEYDVNIIDPIY